MNRLNIGFGRGPFWSQFVAPVLGMAFFWAYFRYQIVFMVLYPQRNTVALGLPPFRPTGPFSSSCLSWPAWR